MSLGPVRRSVALWSALAWATITAVVLPGGAMGATAAPSAAATCDEHSWIAGVTEWCDGVFVYRDYVYDDYGADSGALSPHGTPLNPGAGDVDHRRHGQSLNSADLLALRLRVDGSQLVVRFELNTLFPGDATIAALAIDGDDDPRTGGGTWPGVNVSSTGWDQVHVLRNRDAEANVIEGRVPLPTSAGTFRVQAVVALGDGTPMNVAFRPDDHGNWWEDDQAAALATGDVSAFGARVSLADLRAGLHRPAVARPGFYQRVYTSDYPIREGVDYDGVEGSTPTPYGIDIQGSTATFHYLGRYQPYAIYVPAGDPPYGAQLLLHGLNANHASVGSGLRREMGDAQNRILVSPLGRGPANFWIDWGARDALDALADVEAHYAVDEDAVLVSGYSMGGGGTMQLAAWFPDRFAGAVAWVPFTGSCANGTPYAQGRQRPEALSRLEPVAPSFGNSADARHGCDLGTRGNTLDFLENTRHVPTAYLFAAADELVWVNHGLAVSQRMADLGYVHRLWVHGGEHLTLAILDDWRKEAEWTGGLRRMRRPARVTYRTNTYLWVPELDLVPDGAYWVDRIRPRHEEYTPAGDMVVDLRSHACATGGDQKVAIRRDAGLDPVPWFGQEGITVADVPIAPGNRVSGSLRNVASLRVDVSEACLKPGRPVTFEVETDGPTVVEFSDGRPPVELRPRPSGRTAIRVRP